MILPAEEWRHAIQLGKRWLDDPSVQILFADSNGVVLRKGANELSVRVHPRQIAFEVRNA